MKKLTIGVPKENRLRDKMNLHVKKLKTNRPKLPLSIDFQEIGIFDAWTDVVLGRLDLALTSTEVLIESALAFEQQGFFQPKPEGEIIAVRIQTKPWFVASYVWKDRQSKKITPELTIASEFPLLTQLKYPDNKIYAYSRCVERKVMKAEGTGPFQGEHPVGLGIVETGNSLRENDLVVADTILQVNPMLLIPKSLADHVPLTKDAIFEILKLINGSFHSLTIQVDNPNFTL